MQGVGAVISLQMISIRAHSKKDGGNVMNRLWRDIVVDLAERVMDALDSSVLFDYEL